MSKEIGLAGYSDDKQQLCFAVALWNGIWRCQIELCPARAQIPSDTVASLKSKFCVHERASWTGRDSNISTHLGESHVMQMKETGSILNILSVLTDDISSCLALHSFQNSSTQGVCLCQLPRRSKNGQCFDCVWRSRPIDSREKL